MTYQVSLQSHVICDKFLALKILDYSTNSEVDVLWNHCRCLLLVDSKGSEVEEQSVYQVFMMTEEYEGRNSSY